MKKFNASFWYNGQKITQAYFGISAESVRTEVRDSIGHLKNASDIKITVVHAKDW